MTRLRRLLAAVRASATWHHGLTYFYNLDNYRSDAQVARELRAMARDRPHTIEVCEVIGNTLPDLPGYRLLRDRSTKSRENIAAYVREDLPVGGPWWIDLTEDWGRTSGPGRHEPRSYLVFRLGRMQRITGHQPPRYTDNTIMAQQEGVDAVVRAMAPWTRKGWAERETWVQRRIQRLRPRMLCWDGNRRTGEAGPGPDSVARRIGGEVHLGRRIDHAITRNVDVQSAHVVSTVDGIILESDHHHALRIRWRVRAVWLPLPL